MTDHVEKECIEIAKLAFISFLDLFLQVFRKDATSEVLHFDSSKPEPIIQEDGTYDIITYKFTIKRKRESE